jgi:IclR family acetate operon transcriptional repressor
MSLSFEQQRTGHSARVVSHTGTPLIGTPTPASGTEAATRVADVLLLFACASRELGISEIARTLGICKATVHRIVRSLESREILASARPGGPYALGPTAAIIGAHALQRFDFRATVRPVVHRLQAETGETATVSALIGSARVYLDQVISLHEVKMTVELGRPFPLHAGASSKAVLAFVSESLRSHVLAGALEPLTARTVVDPAALARELDEIRRCGVAVSLGERQAGAASVAAPVFGPDGDVIGAISVCGPADRFSPEAVARLRPAVRSAARLASAACQRAHPLSRGSRKLALSA